LPVKRVRPGYLGNMMHEAFRERQSFVEKSFTQLHLPFTFG